MEKKLRTIGSIMVLLIFGMFWIASIELSDESTDEVVKIENCMDLAQTSGKVRVEVHLDSNPGHYGQIFLSQQKVKPDTCDFDVITNFRHGFHIGDDGKYVYQLDDTWFHNNSEDLWRIEVQLRAGHSFGRDTYIRQVQVQKYNTSNFVFHFKYKETL